MTPKDNKYLPWIGNKKLGGGGNGIVMLVKNPSYGEKEFALKALRNNSSYFVKRFTYEIWGMIKCKDIQGVMPVVDYRLDTNNPWFVTERAIPLSDYREKNTIGLLDAVNICADISRTLNQMHQLGIAHRDIKPENIFLHNKRWCLGDFGLISDGSQERLTSDEKKLGPTFYIAPEMLNEASTSDYFKADVYSLAKLLWVLCSNQNYPLPGTMDKNTESLTISAYCGEGGKFLDTVINLATLFNPEERPSMAQFNYELELWARDSEKGETTNLEPLDLSQYKVKAFNFHAAERNQVIKQAGARIGQNETKARLIQRMMRLAERYDSAFKSAGFHNHLVASPGPVNGLVAVVENDYPKSGSYEMIYASARAILRAENVGYGFVRCTLVIGIPSALEQGGGRLLIQNQSGVARAGIELFFRPRHALESAPSGDHVITMNPETEHDIKCEDISEYFGCNFDCPSEDDAFQKMETFLDQRIKECIGKLVDLSLQINPEDQH